ncbi:MAG: TIGR03943 family protein [Synechococcales bacterium]|nr:TIGR03943 family protein [Synechococcales bacterium]
MARLPAIPAKLLPWLDILAIAAWGILILGYWILGKMDLLIHKNYVPLTVSAGVALLAIAAYRLQHFLRSRRSPQPALQHLSLLPPGWGSCLLLGVAILALLIPPRAFASQTAIQRGVNDAITLTRVRPQAFRLNSNPANRTLVEWIRTLQTYPEPDTYVGQKAKVQGFVVYPSQMAEEYFLITRFVITCCAADVYPVSLPVKLKSGDRRTYPQDQWLEVEGQMITETLNQKRQLVIQATALKPIQQPKNPYEY